MAWVSGLSRLLVGGAAAGLAALGLFVAAPRETSPTPPQPVPSRSPPATIALSPDGLSFVLDGALMDGVGRRLRGLSRAHPEVRLISLSSEGGYVDEAEEIAQVVAMAGLSTYVPDYCASACTLAFVRGRERLAARGASFGFHAPYQHDDDGREVQASSDDERRSYVAAGIAPDFVARALEVPSSDLWLPEPDRLVAAGVVTAFIEPGDLVGRIRAMPAKRGRSASAEP